LQDISTGSTIFTVTATDEDVPDLLTYTIEEGNVVSAISNNNINNNNNNNNNNRLTIIRLKTIDLSTRLYE